MRLTCRMPSDEARSMPRATRLNAQPSGAVEKGGAQIRQTKTRTLAEPWGPPSRRRRFGATAFA